MTPLRVSAWIPAAFISMSAAVGAWGGGRDGMVVGVLGGCVSAAPLCGTAAVAALVPGAVAFVASVGCGFILGARMGEWTTAVASILTLGIGLTTLVASAARGAAQGVGWVVGAAVAAVPLRAIPVDGVVPWWAGPTNPATGLFYAAGIDWFRKPGLYDTLGTAYFFPASSNGGPFVQLFAIIGVTTWVLAGILEGMRRRRGSRSP